MRVYWADMTGIPADAALRPGRSKADGSAFAWSLLERAAQEVWGLKKLPDTALNDAGKTDFPEGVFAQTIEAVRAEL